MMIEQTILEFLSERLPVPCYMAVPEQAPDRFVVLEKTGSSEDDGLHHSVFAVQSYGPRGESGLYDAAQLNEQVRDVLLDIPVLPEVSRCEVNTDYNFPDTTRKRPRYQAVFELVHY